MDVMAEWDRYRHEAEVLATACRLDPERALLDQVEPEIECGDQKVYTRATALELVNVRAGWLRGAAKKVIPANFKWMVQEMIGGGAALLLLSHEE